MFNLFVSSSIVKRLIPTVAKMFVCLDSKLYQAKNQNMSCPAAFFTKENFRMSSELTDHFKSQQGEGDRDFLSVLNMFVFLCAGRGCRRHDGAAGPR